MFKRLGLWALGTCIALAGTVFGQGEVHTPRVHAIQNVRIVTAPGQVIENGTIVVRDGLIEAVGPDVTPPPDARLWDHENLWVYPGMIDLAMEVTVPKPGEDAEDAESLEHDLEVVKADRSLADGVSLKESELESYRNAGILTARAVAADGTFRGRSAVLNTGSGPLVENLLVRSAGQVASFKGQRGGYPQSTMGVVAVIRQTLSDADWYRRAHAIYAKSPRGLERPAFNAALDALVPAMNGEEPFLFITDDVLDVIRADGIAREFGVSFEYLGSGQEYRRLEDVKAAAPGMIIPVDYPKAPSVAKEMGKNLQVSTGALRHWDMAAQNPGKVYGAGINMALTAYGLKDPADFRKNVAKAIDAGLPRDAALAACTTVPADMAGLSNQVGRIEPGLLANLVITDGELFTDSTSVAEVWVDGERYEVEVKEPPVGDPRGKWDYTINFQGMELPGSLSITGEIGALAATIDNEGSDVEATCSQSGKNITLTFDGAPFGVPGTVRINLTFDGDSAEGSGNSAMGDFGISATRVESFGETPGMKGAR